MFIAGYIPQPQCKLTVFESRERIMEEENASSLSLEHMSRVWRLTEHAAS